MERALALSQGIGDDEGIGRAYYNLSFLVRADGARAHGPPACDRPGPCGEERRPGAPDDHPQRPRQRPGDAQPSRGGAGALSSVDAFRARAEAGPQPGGGARQHGHHREPARALRGGPGAHGGGGRHPCGRGPDGHAGREPRQPGRSVARAGRAGEGPRALRALAADPGGVQVQALPAGADAGPRRAARGAGRARPGRGAAAARIADRPRGGRPQAHRLDPLHPGGGRGRAGPHARGRRAAGAGGRPGPPRTATAACAWRPRASARAWRSGAATRRARWRRRRGARAAAGDRRSPGDRHRREPALPRAWRRSAAPPRPWRRASARSPCTPAPPPPATCTSGTASWRGCTRRWGRKPARASTTSGASRRRRTSTACSRSIASG